MIFPWYLRFNKFKELFMKLNTISIILKGIWITMIAQMLWETCT